MTVATAPVSDLKIVPCTIDEVLAYEHPALVIRLQKKLGITPKVAARLFEDAKRFLYLCAVNTKPISPNETLDFVWHEFILFMRDYECFCMKYFGRLIYHRPHYPDDLPTKGEGGRRALALAHQIFGENLSENWSYPCLNGAGADACDNCGCQPACNDPD